ncbi:hypothetical protein KPH14_005250 [Odynerus spinipes]|uniref:Uncharacterized protein n=1 Tax=Odynerus spinipes TaxID=1348599 RepID=A0AAD9RBV1_9HYME|nr:hypothetical protein KPH14_005250 [Odynerus spinipes]
MHSTTNGSVRPELSVRVRYPRTCFTSNRNTIPRKEPKQEPREEPREEPRDADEDDEEDVLQSGNRAEWKIN